MPVDDPFDHNVECRFCDEQAMHRADCFWLLTLIAKVETQEQVITNQLRNLGALRAQLDALKGVKRVTAVTARCRACGAYTDDITVEYEN